MHELKAKLEAIERSISPEIIKKVTGKAMIMISPVFENICETFNEVKKFEVVKDARTQTKNRNPRITMSQVKRIWRVFEVSADI
jgi:hypothetical protein